MTSSITNGGDEDMKDVLKNVIKVIRKYSIDCFGNKSIIPIDWVIDDLAIWMIEYSCKYKVELALMLAQATVECHFGVDPNARRSRKTKNIFNVGNVDSGADETQKSWEAGIERYAKLMNKEYYWGFNDGWVTMAMMEEHDFTRPVGGRYATASDYTVIVKSVYNKIKKILV